MGGICHHTGPSISTLKKFFFLALMFYQKHHKQVTHVLKLNKKMVFYYLIFWNNLRFRGVFRRFKYLHFQE